VKSLSIIPALPTAVGVANEKGVNARELRKLCPALFEIAGEMS